MLRFRSEIVPIESRMWIEPIGPVDEISLSNRGNRLCSNMAMEQPNSPLFAESLTELSFNGHVWLLQYARTSQTSRNDYTLTTSSHRSAEDQGKESSSNSPPPESGHIGNPLIIAGGLWMESHSDHPAAWHAQVGATLVGSLVVVTMLVESALATSYHQLLAEPGPSISFFGSFGRNWMKFGNFGICMFFKGWAGLG